MSQQIGNDVTAIGRLREPSFGSSHLFIPTLPGKPEFAPRWLRRHTLGATRILLLIRVALAQAVASMATESQSNAPDPLAPVRHIANDPNLGSYLLHNPAQRSAFGVPTEAIWATEEFDPTVLAEFESELLSKIIRRPIELAISELYPVELAIAEMASETPEYARELLDNPYDRVAQARVLATALRMSTGLSEASR